MNELQNLVELLDASKTEHILPNDNTAEYNEGYVKGMNVAMNRIKELSLFSVSKSLPSDIEIGKAMSELSEIADKEAER